MGQGGKRAKSTMSHAESSYESPRGKQSPKSFLRLALISKKPAHSSSSHKPKAVPKHQAGLRSKCEGGKMAKGSLGTCTMIDWKSKQVIIPTI